VVVENVVAAKVSDTTVAVSAPARAEVTAREGRFSLSCDSPWSWSVDSLIQPGDLDTWGRYARAGSHGLLTVLVFGSVLIGRPFTESYAREKTATAAWHTPGFHAFNRDISLVWGLAFLVGTVSLVLAGAIDHAQMVLRMVVPFGALLYAFKYTQQRAGQTAKALTPTR
jgi:hypothetical protein